MKRMLTFTMLAAFLLALPGMAQEKSTATKLTDVKGTQVQKQPTKVEVVVQPVQKTVITPVVIPQNAQKADPTYLGNQAPVQTNDGGFPQYVNTGDPQKDQDAYQKAKDEWIMQHPEEYRAMQQSQTPQK